MRCVKSFWVPTGRQRDRPIDTTNVHGLYILIEMYDPCRINSANCLVVVFQHTWPVWYTVCGDHPTSE